jgi:hypothetical protein
MGLTTGESGFEGQHLDFLWRPSSLLYSTKVSFLGDKAVGCEIDHSLTSNAKVKNTQSYKPISHVSSQCSTSLSIGATLTNFVNVFVVVILSLEMEKHTVSSKGLYVSTGYSIQE